MREIQINANVFVLKSLFERHQYDKNYCTKGTSSSCLILFCHSLHKPSFGIDSFIIIIIIIIIIIAVVIYFPALLPLRLPPH